MKNNAMKDFFITNGWAIAIGIASLAASYALYGYRITALEGEQTTLQAKLDTLNTQQTQIQVDLAQINTNLEYIKSALGLKTAPFGT